MHPTVQAAFTQACGVQSVVGPLTHLPAPSQVDCPTIVPVRPTVLQAAAAQIVPADSGAHEPALPVRLQEAQLPQDALEQQTPSVHMVLAHSAPAVQVVPFALRLVQIPEMQL
jgi:hypothetical protein